MTSVYIALDQGGQTSRASLIDGGGRTMAQTLVPIATYRHTEHGHATDRVEHDPEELVASLRTALEDIAAAALAHGAQSVGLATQRSSIVCWDRVSGAALSPVISWQDRRNTALVEQLRPQSAQIHARTGLVLSPHYGASKLRWCLEHLPQVAQAAQTGRLAMGPLSSFLLFRLLDHRSSEERPCVVDPANAARTQLWDLAQRDWSPELLQLFGIAREYLPLSVQSRHDFGTVRVGGMTLPLRVCTGDQSTVPFAFGAAELNTAYINMGTGAFIQRPIADAVIAPPLLSSIVWSEAGKATYVLEGTVNGAASALNWFADIEGLEASRMLTALGEQGAAAQVPLFLNGISGLGSPFWAPDFESRFVGNGTPQEKFIAVAESIIFLIRLNLDEIQHHAAHPATKLDRIVLTGGLSGADFVCRSLANLTGLPVTRYGDHEATSRGLAFLLAERPTHWPSPQGEQIFEPHSDTVLLERFFAWLKEMKRALGRE